MFANIPTLSEKAFMRALMAAMACALFLSACGIKGALYLPPSDPAPAGAPPAEETPAEPPPSDRSE
jgi:predicted small lipoprotein YifL